jgi:uncharacterized membrane protein YukC
LTTHFNPNLSEIHPASSSQSYLILEYNLPVEGQALDKILLTQMSRLDRLRLALLLVRKLEKTDPLVLPFISPKLLFVNQAQEQVVVIHYGLRHYLYPQDFNEDRFYLQIRAIVFYIFYPKLNYDFLQTEVGKEFKTLKKTKCYVNKWLFIFFRGTSILLAIMLIFGAFQGSCLLQKQYKQEALVAAYHHYLADNSAASLDDLKAYALPQLPKESRYLLAMAAVRVSNLTENEKEIVLNHLSPQTDNNTLAFWVYSGRGDFQKALNLAKNIGESQLILYSYQNLYQLTLNDKKMAGKKKQKLLDQYQDEINRMEKKLE